MSEFRQNLATKEWVILAPERAARVRDFIKVKVERETQPPYKKDCPFCMGNEAKTEEPVYAYPSSGKWQVRVIPNKYAALQSNVATTRTQVGSFLAAKGFGVAEVVIEHPRHDQTLATMTTEEVACVLYSYRQRYLEMRGNEKVNLITIFRNHGSQAGTSLEHPHSQIIATPIVPPHVRYPMEEAVMYYDKYGHCVYCEMVEEELRQKERIISETENFAAFCPFAAKSPFECRIYPKKHIASYMLTNDADIADLAQILRETLARLYVALGDPDYNYIIRSAPIGDENTRHMHWYMVIIPKVSIPAGFEIGSGIYINSMPPEESAQILRETKIFSTTALL